MINKTCTAYLIVMRRYLGYKKRVGNSKYSWIPLSICMRNKLLTPSKLSGLIYYSWNWFIDLVWVVLEMYCALPILWIAGICKHRPCLTILHFPLLMCGTTAQALKTKERLFFILSEHLLKRYFNQRRFKCRHIVDKDFENS